MIQAPHQLGDQFDRLVEVVTVNHAVVVVQVARRDSEVDHGRPSIGALHLGAVLAVAGDHFQLQRDPNLISQVDHEVAQFDIRDHRTVDQKDARAPPQALLGLIGIDARIVGRHPGFNADSNIRLDDVAAGLSASQPDFFLHGRRREYHVGGGVALEPLEYLDRHSHAGAVVPGLGDVELGIVELHESRIRRNGVARADAQAPFSVLAARCADVNEDLVLGRQPPAFLLRHDVRGFESGDTADHAVARAYEIALVDQRLIEDAAQGLKLDESAGRDVLDNHADLVEVGRDHDSRAVVSEAGDERAEAIGLDLVGQRLELTPNDLPHRALESAGAVGVGQLLEQALNAVEAVLLGAAGQGQRRDDE